MSLAERRRQGTGLEAAVDSLSLEGSSKAKAKKAKAEDEVADSWEDEADDSAGGSDTETEGPPLKPSMPGPPPPTPVTPGYNKPAASTSASADAEFDDPYAVRGGGSSSNSRAPRGAAAADGRRPEKQNATASRMIAGALGLKAPRRTEEQRSYDRAVREREQKKKDKEKEERKKAEEDIEKAKASVWDD